MLPDAGQVLISSSQVHDEVNAGSQVKCRPATLVLKASVCWECDHVSDGDMCMLRNLRQCGVLANGCVEWPGDRRMHHW